MSDRLPPLTALRAFDAAARHMSFAKAADELNVTPAALSFQIKSLEEHLGAPLFRRLNRAVELTQAGRQLAPAARDGFEILQDGWRATRRGLDGGRITVTAGPAFTAKWLAPRLFKFAKAHPDIELRLAASLKLMDFHRDEIDVAIRFGMGEDSPDLCTRPIISEWLTPMMHPDLARELQTPADLAHATLLHHEDTRFLDHPTDWPAWFRAAGLGEPPSGGPRLTQSDHAVDAALAGAGVVLGRISLAERDLQEGRLVAPFKTALSTEAHYRMICLKGQESRPQIASFMDWILREAETMKPHAEGRQFVAAGDLARP